MAAFYADEEEVWKCPEHPSRRRAIGVCPSCLRERLAALCPECANVRPCGCCCSASASSSSCSSSSVSYISLSNHNNSSARVSSLMENEPSFRRSRSVALFPSLFKSGRFSNASELSITDRSENQEEEASTNKSRSRSRSFWLFFWPQRTRRDHQEQTIATTTEGFATMRRSRSVAVGVSGGRGDMMMRSGKSKGWYYFPSPMKVFRHSSSTSNRKTTSSSSSKIVQERSPLHRG